MSLFADNPDGRFVVVLVEDLVLDWVRVGQVLELLLCQVAIGDKLLELLVPLKLLLV